MSRRTPASHDPVVTVLAVRGMPEIVAGDDVARSVTAALSAQGTHLVDDDIVVVSSKICSKAAGLRAPAARREELVLAESTRIVTERATPTGVTRVVQTLAGPVMAGAGIDASNVGVDDDETVLLLPRDPDEVASRLRDALLRSHPGLNRLGVVVSDTAGRPWRVGQVDFALGAAGLAVLDDLRGARDADGRALSLTARAVADEIAAAADLVKGKVSAIPAAVVRGLQLSGSWGVAEVMSDASRSTGTTTGPPAVPGDPPADPPDRMTPPAAEPQGARDLVRTGPGDWFAFGGIDAVRHALGAPPGSAAAHRVGLPGVGPENGDDVIARAVALALVDEAGLGSPQVGVRIGTESVRLETEDPFVLGAVTARAVAALRAEGVEAVLAPRDPTTPGTATIRTG